MVKTFLADLARVFHAPRSLYRDISRGRSTASWLCVLLYGLVYVGGGVVAVRHGAPGLRPVSAGAG